MLRKDRDRILMIAIVSLVILMTAILFRKKDNTVKISIVGDIMLSRDVEYYLIEYGYDYPYEEVKDIFINDDFTIGNLECPITLESNSANKTKRFIFKAEPENAKALKNAGFDCLNLANNHTMDYLSNGLIDTIGYLEENDIVYIGTLKDEDTNGIYVFEKNGVKVGIIAYSALPPEGYFYNKDKIDVRYISATDLSVLEDNIKNIKCDFTIVYFHWGNEYETYNSKTQEEIAKKAIDAGGDLIIGSHPHVLQNTENYKGKYIYYSLGNFIFDRQIQKGTDESVILQIEINTEGLLNIEEIPVIIRDAKAEIK